MALTGRTSWYKIRKKKRETLETAKLANRDRKERQIGTKTRREKVGSKVKTEEKTPSSVIFVDRTEGGGY